MFERVYPARKRTWRRALLSESTLASVAIHIAGLAALVASGASPVDVARGVTQGIVYLAPPPTPAAAPASEAERLAFAELAPPTLAVVTDAFDPMTLATQATAPPPAAARDEPGRGEEPEKVAPAFSNPALTVYFAHQVESPAAFDSRSAAPAYPDSLQRAGIEGSVIAQFIVDTTGRIEPASIVLLESTHIRFTESVQAALPNMLFRPAELRGVKSRQMVQIPFRFRIDRDTTTPPDTIVTPPAGRGRGRPPPRPPPPPP